MHVRLISTPRGLKRVIIQNTQDISYPTADELERSVQAVL
jgi:hypothetical protein